MDESKPSDSPRNFPPNVLLETPRQEKPGTARQCRRARDRVPTYLLVVVVSVVVVGVRASLLVLSLLFAVAATAVVASAASCGLPLLLLVGLFFVNSMFSVRPCAS